MLDIHQQQLNTSPKAESEPDELGDAGEKLNFKPLQ